MSIESIVTTLEEKVDSTLIVGGGVRRGPTHRDVESDVPQENVDSSDTGGPTTLD